MSDSKAKVKWGIFGVGIIAIYILTFIFKSDTAPVIFGIRSEFFLFGITLLGVAVLHDNTLEVALIGMISILTLKLLLDPQFHFVHHAQHEWQILTNLGGLLLGFAILAKIFETSNIPELLPRYLPQGWLGGFVLLCLVFVMSSFLDNIAAAMIGGTIALSVFNKKVHIGYLAAIVASSNAGGAGSVLGDTTTTMMWIDGVDWHIVLDAYVAAVPALLFFGIFASMQQNKFQTIIKNEGHVEPIKWKNIMVVLLILAGTIIANIKFDFPAAGVWAAILVGALIIKAPWEEIPKSIKGTCFLLCLVLAASMMPVKELPEANVTTAFGLGFLSSVFDNIPLTKLALDQGGYDWGILAFAVGFGGSMLWFGSSAGVAISNMYPEAKSAINWVKAGWHIPVAYVMGFAILYYSLGWHEDTHISKSKQKVEKAVEGEPVNEVKKAVDSLEHK